MDYNRYLQEKQVIDHFVKNKNTYQFGGLDTSCPYLRIAAQTNNNNVYVLHFTLANYPNEKPNVYVECMLRDCHGNLMNTPSAENHTLAPHPRGWTQICHYHPSAWSPSLSLWLVYIRCVVWLNIYEQTKRTGRDMQYYLSHMGNDYRY